MRRSSDQDPLMGHDRWSSSNSKFVSFDEEEEEREMMLVSNDTENSANISSVHESSNIKLLSHPAVIAEVKELDDEEEVDQSDASH